MLRVLVLALPPVSGAPLSNKDNVHSRQSETVQELCSLVCAFPFACMYRLRDQSGVSQPEVRRLLPDALVESFRATPSEDRRPSIGSTSSAASFVDHSSATEEERAISGLNAPPSQTRSIPFALPHGEPSNLPLSLIRATHAYLNAYHSTPMSTKSQPSESSPAIDAVTYGTCVGYLKEFSDQLTSLERIRDSESPVSSRRNPPLVDARRRCTQRRFRSSSTFTSNYSSSCTSLRSRFSSSKPSAGSRFRRPRSPRPSSLGLTALRKS